eukprot:1219205-Rhodomonas_salina.2
MGELRVMVTVEPPQYASQYHAGTCHWQCTPASGSGSESETLQVKLGAGVQFNAALRGISTDSAAWGAAPAPPSCQQQNRGLLSIGSPRPGPYAPAARERRPDLDQPAAHQAAHSRAVLVDVGHLVTAQQLVSIM